MSRLYRDERDTTDPIDRKLRRAVYQVEHCLDDRWPARGQANIRTREWEPLEDVSRQGRQEEYKKRPNAKG